MADGRSAGRGAEVGTGRAPPGCPLLPPSHTQPLRGPPSLHSELSLGVPSPCPHTPTSHCAQNTAGAPGLLSTSSQRHGAGYPHLPVPQPLGRLPGMVRCSPSSPPSGRGAPILENPLLRGRGDRGHYPGPRKRGSTILSPPPRPWVGVCHPPLSQHCGVGFPRYHRGQGTFLSGRNGLGP